MLTKADISGIQKHSNSRGRGRGFSQQIWTPCPCLSVFYYCCLHFEHWHSVGWGFLWAFCVWDSSSCWDVGRCTDPASSPALKPQRVVAIISCSQSLFKKNFFISNWGFFCVCVLIILSDFLSCFLWWEYLVIQDMQSRGGILLEKTTCKFLLILHAINVVLAFLSASQYDWWISFRAVDLVYWGLLNSDW